MNRHDAYNLFHRGSIALAEVEAAGIRIDLPYLDKAIVKISEDVARIEEEMRADPLFRTWRAEFGPKTNVGSRQQLSHVLFDVLKYASKGTTAKGRKRMDKLALEGIDLPFVKRFLEAEGLKKLKAVSLEGLKREVCDGLLHPDLPLHTVKSYRGSSGGMEEERGYNTQNIPARDVEQAAIVRKAFIARPGRRIVENDFAAHEFKLAAIIWGDTLMQEYATDKRRDIHRDMAARCYKLSKADAAQKQVRYCGKNGFVFPKLYGSWWKSIAAAMWGEIANRGLKRADGVGLYEHLKEQGINRLGDGNLEPGPGTFERHIRDEEIRFHKRFKVFTDNCDRAWKDYQRKGRFELITGFRVDGVYSRNARLNYAVQGPAFHCLLWCLTDLVNELVQRRGDMKAVVVNTIHDCIVGDVPDNEVQVYLNLLKEIVEERLPRAFTWLGKVPLEIEAEVTPVNGNWHQKAIWLEKEGTWAPKA